VEFGQQRQRLKLNKFFFNIKELIELFSGAFNTEFNLQRYEIVLLDERLDSMTVLDFTQLENYSRFRIQLNNKQCSSAEEIVNTNYR
jgi:hypothetical protein